MLLAEDSLQLSFPNMMTKFINYILIRIKRSCFAIKLPVSIIMRIVWHSKMCVSGINSCNVRVIILRGRVLLSKFTFLHHLFELKHFSLTFYWTIGKLKLVYFIWLSFWVLIFLLYSLFQLNSSPFSMFLVLHSIVYSTTASHWADWSI